MTEDSEIKRNFLPILRFLAEQILSELDRSGLEAFDDFDANAVREVEQSLPPVPERNWVSEMAELDEEALSR